MDVAILCTGLLGLLVFGLGMLVSFQRGQSNVLYAGDPDPTNRTYRLIRAHGNAIEYAPMLAVLILFLGSAVAVGIAVAALPIFQRYSAAMAIWLMAVAVAGFALQAADNSALLSVLSLSQDHTKANAAKLDLYELLAAVNSSER